MNENLRSIRRFVSLASTAALLSSLTLFGEVSAATLARPSAAMTGFLNPSGTSAVTVNAGDNNGFQTSATGAIADAGLAAVDTNSGTNTSTNCLDNGKDKQNFSFFVVVGPTGTLPTTATITGVELRVDARADSTAGTPRLCARLSSDSGATWTTTVLSTTTLSTGEVTYQLGNAAQLWGRAWTPANFSGGVFRVQIIPVSSSTSRDFTLDWLALKIHYN
jgi:hypothetical protein